jgi:hypothetical protein
MHVNARVFTLDLLCLFMHKVSSESQFKTHVARTYWLFLSCFLDLVPQAWFWCFGIFCSVLDSNIFVYVSVTCWDKESMF